MKIIIIGAGVSGLSAYLFLKKHLLSTECGKDISVRMYEAYDIAKLNLNTAPLNESADDEPVFASAAVGGALGISKNGLNVLRRMDSHSSILNQIRRRGNVTTSWRMSNARGWTLAHVDLVPKSSRNKEDAKASVATNDASTLMIARQDIWEVLRDEAGKNTDIISSKRVENVVIGNSMSRSVVHFTDNTSEEADLVIGADGLRSTVRRAMFQDEMKNNKKVEHQPTSGFIAWLTSWWYNNSMEVKDYITPQYEGLAGLGGFMPTEDLMRNSNFDPKCFNIVFGPNGFLGYGCISSSPKTSPGSEGSSSSNADKPIQAYTAGPVSGWWSTWGTTIPYPYRQEPPPSDPNSPSTFDSSRALGDLLSRHRTWRNPTIQRILDHVSETGVKPSLFYPTWTTPELPRWTQDGRVVLIGDAAHALQPSSGQGASQALEDAESLTLLLRHYLGSTDIGDRDEQHKAIATALEKFETLRKPRVHVIYARSQRMSKTKHDMGFFSEMLMYAIIWITASFFNNFNDAVVNYDIAAETEKIIREHK